MKKIIAAVLVVVVLAGLGFGGWKVYDNEILSNPENQIIGEWKTENELLSFTFKEDGVMSGTVNLPIVGNVSIEGSYTVDRELSELSITYSFSSLSYNDTKRFVIEENKLTLTDVKTDIQTVYYKVIDEA